MKENTPEIKEDKRKKTSSQNLAKARQAKLDKLKQEKIDKAKEYEFNDESDSDSSSDDEAIIIKPRKKKNTKPQTPIEKDPIKQELAENLFKVLQLRRN